MCPMQQRLKAVLLVFSLPARFLHTDIAVISADVLVVLNANMNGMQASKARLLTHSWQRHQQFRTQAEITQLKALTTEP